MTVTSKYIQRQVASCEARPVDRDRAEPEWAMLTLKGKVAHSRKSLFVCDKKKYPVKIFKIHL